MGGINFYSLPLGKNIPRTNTQQTIWMLFEKNTLFDFHMATTGRISPRKYSPYCAYVWFKNTRDLIFRLLISLCCGAVFMQMRSKKFLLLHDTRQTMWSVER